jgi:hypothetical protein
MDTVYLVVETLDRDFSSYGKYWGDKTKTIIGIFQEEEQALQILGNLKPLSEKIKVDGVVENRDTGYHIQKISEGTILSISDGSDNCPEYLFPLGLIGGG